MTTVEYIKRLRRTVLPPAAQDLSGSAAAPGEETKPMRAHRAFASLLDETRGAAAHMRGVQLPKLMETPRCLLTPLI